MSVSIKSLIKCGEKAGALLRRFRNDTRGTVAIVVGISAIPLLLAAGVAVDMARASHEAQSFQAAVDASALAVAASDQSNLAGLTDAQKTARKNELKVLAQKYVDKNYSNKFGDKGIMTVDIDVSDENVLVTGKYKFPTAIMRIVGITTLNINAKAEVKKSVGISEGVEIIMVMDTTGSMLENNKIGAAKTAAKDLIKEVLGTKTTDANIKFALVPFSGGVQVGSQYRDSGWIDTKGDSSVSRLNFTDQAWHNMRAWDDINNVDWNGCVEARPGDLAVNDTPATGGDTLFPVYFAPDEPDTGYYPNDYMSDGTNSNDLTRQKYQKKYKSAIGNSNLRDGYWPGFNCATAPIVPLTNSRAIIESGIDDMSASGSTVIPEGLAWGWRVGSSGAPFSEGAPDNDKFWRKVIVLMTDGENNVLSQNRWTGAEEEVNSLNGSFYNAYGYGKAAVGNRFGTTDSYQLDTALNTKLASLCSNIKGLKKPDPKDKTKQIPVYEIYTVAFDVDTATIENLLKACATDPEHYANASSNEQLKNIFAAIGERLKVLYLSK